VLAVGCLVIGLAWLSARRRKHLKLQWSVQSRQLTRSHCNCTTAVWNHALSKCLHSFFGCQRPYIANSQNRAECKGDYYRYTFQDGHPLQAYTSALYRLYIALYRQPCVAVHRIDPKSAAPVEATQWRGEGRSSQNVERQTATVGDGSFGFWVS